MAERQRTLDELFDDPGQKPVREGGRSSKDQGSIYFISIPRLDLIKVGFATDLRLRLAGIKTASPFDLQLVASYRGRRDDEQRAHRLLKPHRYKREWFRYHDDVDALIYDMYDYRLVVAAEIEEREGQNLNMGAAKLVTLDGFWEWRESLFEGAVDA
jgi:hypothetical protein